MNKNNVRKIVAVFFSRILCIWMTCIALFSATESLAQGEYFNFTLQGSYERTHDELASKSKSTIGGELSIPLSNILEVSLSHSLYKEKKTYTAGYRNMIIKKYRLNDTDLPPTLEGEENIIDTSLDAGIGYAFGYVRPSVFGGVLWRTDCLQDSFNDYGCSKQNMTWNAGFAIAFYVTRSVRLKVSYRISPSVRTDNAKTTNDLTSIGITWGY